MKKILLSIALIAATTAFVNAQGPRAYGPPAPGPQNNRDYNYNAPQSREYNLDMMIREGLRRGTLTRREADRLQRQQQNIDRVIFRAKADGFVSPRERAEIDHLQDNLRRDIARQNMDYQRRPNSW